MRSESLSVPGWSVANLAMLKSALLSLRGVTDASAITRARTDGVTQVVALVTVEPCAHLEPQDVMKALKLRFEPSRCPDQILVVVDSQARVRLRPAA